MISFFHMELSFASIVSFSIESLLRDDLMWCCSLIEIFGDEGEPGGVGVADDGAFARDGCETGVPFALVCLGVVSGRGRRVQFASFLFCH